MKRIRYFFLIILAFLFIVYLYHAYQLRKESELLKDPLGEIVEVNGQAISIYRGGIGDATLVFMSGSGTTSPILDFMTLAKHLEDHYSYIIIEKPGYGYSEMSSVSRDVKTINQEYRQALAEVNISGPLILVPHSMSGIDAIYWAQTYPEEIKGIVGLDMVVPSFYPEYQPNQWFLKLVGLLNRIGLTRLLPKVAKSQAELYGDLTDREKEITQALFYRNTLSGPMLEEIAMFQENAKFVLSNGEVKVPVLLFSSDTSDLGLNPDAWIKSQEEFMARLPNQKKEWIKLQAPHYVHNHRYQEIAEKIIGFFD